MSQDCIEVQQVKVSRKDAETRSKVLNDTDRLVINPANICSVEVGVKEVEEGSYCTILMANGNSYVVRGSPGDLVSFKALPPPPVAPPPVKKAQTAKPKKKTTEDYKPAARTSWRG